MRFDPPPWHKVFPLGTCVDLISSIIRSYCRDALVAVRREGADRSESDAPPLVFEEVVAAPPANDTPSIDAISIPSIDAPIPAQLSYAAAKVFGKFVLRPRQVTAVHKLVYCKSSEGKLLVVDRTGGGKSLILSLAAVMVGGITYVIIPLLALTANQMAKLKEALTDDGAIEVHHLEELKKSAVRTKANHQQRCSYCLLLSIWPGMHCFEMHSFNVKHGELYASLLLMKYICTLNTDAPSGNAFGIYGMFSFVLCLMFQRRIIPSFLP